MDRYDANTIEEKWQRIWEDARAFYVSNPEPGAVDEPHWYQLEMLPYPSGILHMGHVLNYTMGDVVTHFRRRHGWRVLRPMGYDSFGLPAENAAINDGVDPRESTERNIVNIRAQMKRLGWAIDWDREVSTHDPDFYRWTQWLFLKFFEAGLAYRKEAPVNWCPNDQTVLANEQVIDGRCERCGAEVELRKLAQWFFKITDYADELLTYELPPGGEWPERTMTIQRNWIGRSEGAEVDFRIADLDADVSVFTTRPDTLFGATFFVLAPEHPLVDEILARSPDAAELRDYVRHAGAKPAEERAAAEEKTGVFTGFYATNPVNDAPIPIWVADYVLMDYGTGAIMAVPAHDERDEAFATKFGLPIVAGDRRGRQRSCSPGSSPGMPADEAKRGDRRVARRAGPRQAGDQLPPARLELLAAALLGLPDPDRLLRRLRRRSPVPDDELPLLLPEVEDYRPKGQPPLASNEEWMHVACPKCGKHGVREADTMDTFVDSAWYFLRYVDPHDDDAPFDRAAVDYWLPVSQYIGGIDHATGHLLYSRFFVKVLNDMGMVGFREPFARLFHQGWVQHGRHEDVEVEGERHRPRRARARVRRRRRPALHPLHGPRGPGHGVDARRHRRHVALRAPALAHRARGVRGAGVERRADRPARAQGARDDRARQRRHRPALPVQHADRRGDGARERALEGRGVRSGGALRRRDGRLADPAVRAARRRGALAAARPRAPLGAPVAGGRRVVPRARRPSSSSCR